MQNLTMFLNFKNFNNLSVYKKGLISDFGDELVPLSEIVKILKANQEDVLVSIGDLNGFYSMILGKYVKEIHVIIQEDLWFEYVKKLSLKFGMRNVIPHKEDPCQITNFENYTKFFIKTRGISLTCMSNVSKKLGENNTIKTGLILGTRSPPFFNSNDLSKDSVIELFKSSGFTRIIEIDFRYHYALLAVK